MPDPPHSAYLPKYLYIYSVSAPGQPEKHQAPAFPLPVRAAPLARVAGGHF